MRRCREEGNKPEPIHHSFVFSYKGMERAGVATGTRASIQQERINRKRSSLILLPASLSLSLFLLVVVYTSSSSSSSSASPSYRE